MSLPIASLTGNLNVAYFGWLDITGDVVRATTMPGGYTFGASETGDADLDGKTFTYLPNELVKVGDVTHATSGSSTLDVELSGLTGQNDTLLAALAGRSNWQGRYGRLWHALYSGASITYIAGYYTGVMTKALLGGDPVNGSRVTMSLENYLAILTSARSRTYQDQAEHDSGDLSPSRIRAASNGGTTTAIVSSLGAGSAPSVSPGANGYPGFHLY